MLGVVAGGLVAEDGCYYLRLKCSQAGHYLLLIKAKYFTLEGNGK